MLRIEFLGTGTSFGVPEIGCDCEVCRSPDPRDQRLRCSLWIRHRDLSIIIDTGPDFRQQCLRSRVPRLDAVFITHMHADHIFGIDDVRKYNFLQQSHIPVHVPSHEAAIFREWFDYALKPAAPGLTRPRFELHELHAGATVEYEGLRIVPLDVDHGAQMILGYLLDTGTSRFAYLTDCKHLPPATREAVAGADVVVLGALWDRDRTHPGHLNLREASALADELGCARVYFTHVTHLMGLHREVLERLPAHQRLAHDGLVVELA